MLVFDVLISVEDILHRMRLADLQMLVLDTMHSADQSRLPPSNCNSGLKARRGLMCKTYQLCPAVINTRIMRGS